MKSLNNPTNNKSALSIDEAISRLNIDDLHYLLFTMADIVKYLSDNEAMYNDLKGQGCIQGAVRIEDLVKQELIQRIETELHNKRMESYRGEDLKNKSFADLVDEALANLEDITDSHPDLALRQYKRLVKALAKTL